MSSHGSAIAAADPVDVTSQILSALDKEKVAVQLLDGKQFRGRLLGLHAKNHFGTSSLTVPTHVEFNVLVDTDQGNIEIALPHIASTITLS